MKISALVIALMATGTAAFQPLRPTRPNLKVRRLELEAGADGMVSLVKDQIPNNTDQTLRNVVGL